MGCAAFKRPPFRIEEEGWGEFDMEIILTALEKGGEHSLPHDLNFQSERYEAKHNVVSFERHDEIR
jgi:transcription initiation factor IIF auxiliary subunit